MDSSLTLLFTSCYRTNKKEVGSNGSHYSRVNLCWQVAQAENVGSAPLVGSSCRMGWFRFRGGSKLSLHIRSLHESGTRSIAHPHLEAADKALRRAIQEPGGASIINVFGPARVGKSTMKNHVMRTIILEMLPLLQQDRERVPLLSLMARPPLSGYFNWKVFFQDGLVAFDEPLIDHKIAHDPEDNEGQSGLTRLDDARIRRKLPEGSKDALRQSFVTTVKRRRPVAIFIDEAQHLDRVSSERHGETGESSSPTVAGTLHSSVQ